MKIRRCTIFFMLVVTCLFFSDIFGDKVYSQGFDWFNRAPVLSSIETDAINFCLNSDELLITSTLKVSDSDDNNLISASISISGYVTNEDILMYTNQNGISGTWNASSGILLLSGFSSISNYQNALRTIKYKNINKNTPQLHDREISFVVTDTRKTSNTAQRTIKILQSPNVEISGLNDIYNKQSKDWVPLAASPSGGTFSGQGVISSENKWYFVPNIAPVGLNKIVYEYSSPGSCKGYDSAIVRVLETTAFIEFENNRMKHCKNGSSFGIHAINLLSNESGKFSISGNVGLTDNGNNTATIYPAQLTAGQHTISYTTSEGFTVNANFEIGAELIADFVWDDACFEAGKSYAFSDASSSTYGSLTNESYSWKVQNGTLYVSYYTPDITHKFSEPGNYLIELQVVNSYGCSDISKKTFPLRPVIKLAGMNYFENFEEANSGWHTAQAVTSKETSWISGNGFSGAFSGVNCWYTNIESNSVPKEESWLISPCFDFNGTVKPMLKAKIFRSFSDSNDGVNLQASIDNGSTWKLIGAIDDGINWYTGNFGNSQTPGWTNIKDQDWIETRHSLNELKDRNLVLLRFAYVANGSAVGNRGIAIDDIEIAEQNKVSLIEHFTNSSDSKSKTADSVIDDFIKDSGSSVIDLQYHTSTPPGDVFYSHNPVVSSTRQFFYGLTIVPYALLNGGQKPDEKFDFFSIPFDKNKVLSESLNDSKFKIELNSLINGTTFYTKTIITALQDIREEEISLRIAVFEPLITSIAGQNGDNQFRNVVKAMLPDAGGILLQRSWNKNDAVNIIEGWDMKNVYNGENLKAAAFIQNNITHEIYQTAIDVRGVFSDVSSPVNEEPRGINVYPNPTKDIVTILFNKETEEPVTLKLFNNIGELIYSEVIQKGTSLKEISLFRYPTGLYLLNISSRNKSVFENFKIIIDR